jgi:hypothetical protein
MRARVIGFAAIMIALLAGPATANAQPLDNPAPLAAEHTLVVGEELRQIRANAALAVSQLGPLSGFDFGFDHRSVAWVEGFIERQRVRGAADGLVDVLGCYLGEALISAAGGAWVRGLDGALGVRFDNGDIAYPFAGVGDQFERGLEGGESIVSFYEISVGFVATGRLRDRGSKE